MLKQPAHPYTELLLDSVAKIGEKWSDAVRLPDMESKEYGYVGCKFAERCPYVRDICRTMKPPMVTVEENREVLLSRWTINRWTIKTASKAAPGFESGAVCYNPTTEGRETCRLTD